MRSWRCRRSAPSFRYILRIGSCSDHYSWSDGTSVKCASFVCFDEVDIAAIIFVNSTVKDGSPVLEEDGASKFPQEFNQWNNISQTLTEGGALCFSGWERDFGLQFTQPDDETVCIWNDVSDPRHDRGWFNAPSRVSFSSKWCIDARFHALLFI